MDLRVLQYFVVLADELHFGRAAKRLLVAQPSLSYAIKVLERELGVSLLLRDRRQVRLTEAGRALLVEAQQTLLQAERVRQVAEQYRLGLAGTLRIGFEATGVGRIGTLAQTRFMERHPQVQLIPRRFDWGGEVAALREGSVDVAYIWLPTLTQGLQLEIIATEARMVALARQHPLTMRTSVSIQDLAEEPIMWTRRAPKVWVDWWAVNPRPDGREPLWGPTNDNVEEMLEQVAAGRAICISPTSMAAYYARPDLVWRPIHDIDPLRIAIGWRETDATPLIQAFVAVVNEVAAEGYQGEGNVVPLAHEIAMKHV